jgi:hypothetical protein
MMCCAGSVTTKQRRSEAMGAGLVEPDAASGCTGADVLKELDAFSNPNSQAYAFAQANNTFGAIQNVPGNSQDLINAYTNAGVPVCAGWVTYLNQLGQQNIYMIAQARDEGLKKVVPMITKKHKHTARPGHVQKTVAPDGTITISSPYNL